MREQTVERVVGEVRHVVNDAQVVERGDEIDPRFGQRPLRRVAARVSRAHRPGEPDQPEALLEPPPRVVGRADRVGAFHQDHEPQPIGLEVVDPAHDPQRVLGFELAVDVELAAAGRLGAVGVARTVLVGVGGGGVGLGEDRPEGDAHVTVGEALQVDAAGRAVGAGAEVPTAHREVGEIEMAVDPGTVGGAVIHVGVPYGRCATSGKSSSRSR